MTNQTEVAIIQLTYEELSKHPHNFIRIISLSIEAFNQLVTKVKPSFQQLEAKKLCHGRRIHLTYPRR